MTNITQQLQTWSFKLSPKKSLIEVYAASKKFKANVFNWDIYTNLKKILQTKISGAALELQQQGGTDLVSHLLPQRPIISLTSYPARIATTHLTIDSLLKQTCKPQKILLWLAESQFPTQEAELPRALLAQKAQGLEIRWCEDTLSYKKLIPALQHYPYDILVTADDDELYDENWLLQLLIEHLLYPDSIICHRAHKILLDSGGNVKPYSDWPKEIASTAAAYSHLFTGCGGVLYPPGSLHADVLKQDTFMTLCPHGDDLWLWTMALINGTTIRLVPNSRFKIEHIPGTQANALWKDNVYKGRNDSMLAALLKTYPEVLERLANESKTQNHSPLISVIIPVYNPGALLKPCLESLQQQTLANFEIICVDDGSSDAQTAKILQEFQNTLPQLQVIRQQNAGPATARNTGIAAARGDYITFLDSDDYLSANYLKSLYATAIYSGADISVASNIWNLMPDGSQSAKRSGFENANSYTSTQALVRQAISATGIVWNKLYKKSFLRQYAIGFIDGMKCQAEDNYFTFFALTHGHASLAIAPDAHYYYRQHEQSITKNASSASLQDSIRVYQAMQQRLQSARLPDSQYWLNVLNQRALKDLRRIAQDVQLNNKERQQLEQHLINQFSGQINVVCIADDKYILPTAVFLQSIKQNQRSTTHCQVTVLTPQDSVQVMQSLKTLSSQGFTVQIKGLDNSWMSDLHQYKEVDDFCMASPSAMFKFIIPDLFPEHDRILYLDTDLMVRGDLLELYMRTTEDVYLLAVPDMWKLVTERENVRDFNVYFNSGVMLLNLAAMRRDGIPGRLIQAKQQSRNFDLMDQDIFNQVCGSRFRLLELANNFLSVCYKRHHRRLQLDAVNRLYRSKYRNVQEMSENSLIVHWAGSDKPWRTVDTPYAPEWRKLAEHFDYKAP